MSLPRMPRRLAHLGLYLFILILFGGLGRALAADSFSGDYGGVCVGITNNTGPDQHYSYWALYSVDGYGGITGSGQMSKQNGGAPPVPVSMTDVYQLFRREGVMMGLNKLPPNRSHGRLCNDLEYGLFLPLYDDDDWYLNFIAPSYGGGDGDVGDLDKDYWFVQYQFDKTAGGSGYHVSVFGSETYDGAGHINVSYIKNQQGVAVFTGGLYPPYLVPAKGELQRYAPLEKGFILKSRIVLATSQVTEDDTWGVSLSAMKPPFGSTGLSSLSGPYWLATIQHNSEGGADLHSIGLGKAYFDGAGKVDLWITRSLKGQGLTHSFEQQTYSLSVEGSFSMNGFTGGIGSTQDIVLAAEVSDIHKQGIMVLIRQSGIEDPSPMCHLLGLAP